MSATRSCGSAPPIVRQSAGSRTAGNHRHPPPPDYASTVSPMARPGRGHADHLACSLYGAFGGRRPSLPAQRAVTSARSPCRRFSDTAARPASDLPQSNPAAPTDSRRPGPETSPRRTSPSGTVATCDAGSSWPAMWINANSWGLSLRRDMPGGHAIARARRPVLNDPSGGAQPRH